MRPPRRSERFPSLVRVDTINGRPADEVSEGTRFEDLPVAWPDERIALARDDPTVKAIEWLTPFGKGSRVVIAGASRSGKSEALRRLAAALAAREGLEVSAVLAGVRPEEVADWPVAPSAALTFAASPDAQAQAVEQAVETGRRVAARGGRRRRADRRLRVPAGPPPRRALAAGRNLADGGSLTVIATSPAPVGGETTVIALDRAAATLGKFPALALGESGHAALGAARGRGRRRGDRRSAAGGRRVHVAREPSERPRAAARQPSPPAAKRPAEACAPRLRARPGGRP